MCVNMSVRVCLYECTCVKHQNALSYLVVLYIIYKLNASIALVSLLVQLMR